MKGILARARALVLILAAAWSGPAGAWVDLDGDTSLPHPVWTTLPVQYYLNSAGSADLGGYGPTETVMQASFASWEAPACTSWAVSYQGATTRGVSSGDGFHILTWVESGWGYESGAIGVTSMSFWSGSSFADADIEFNGVNFTWNTTGSGSGVDTQSIATHEMGHFLGLGDLYDYSSCGGDPKTMCGMYSGGTSTRTLHADDIAGVCALYPSGTTLECTSAADCDAGEECVDNVCVASTPGLGLCEPCTTNEECGGPEDLCMGGMPGGSYCGTDCSSDVDCPAAYQCYTISSTVQQCIPDDFDCVGDPVTPDCTTSDDCGPGEVCSGGICVEDPSPHLPMCAVCTTHDECGGDDDLCLGGFVDGTSRCGVACASVGGSCGDGNICYDFPDVPDQCIPANMDCAPECSTDAQCAPGEHCVGGLCTNVCDPALPTDCPAGYYCRFMNCLTGICEAAPTGPGPLPDGAACGSDLDCQSLRCQGMVGGSFCTRSCSVASASSCTAPQACQPLEGGACGYCSCSAGRMGDACYADGQCQAGSCGDEFDVNMCLTDCTISGWCPAGYGCAPVAWGAASLCLPTLLGFGSPCAADAECQGGLCSDFGGQRMCTRTCGTDGTCGCPAGLECSAGSSGVPMCGTARLMESSACGCSLPGAGGGAGGALALAMAAAALAILSLRRGRGR